MHAGKSDPRVVHQRLAVEDHVVADNGDEDLNVPMEGLVQVKKWCSIIVTKAWTVWVVSWWLLVVTRGLVGN